jgi:hypothetical protein
MIDDDRKQLKKLYYSRSEIACLYEISPRSLRKEITTTKGLLKQLSKIGYDHHSKRPLHRKMVIQIFRSMGAPAGYEYYETIV